MTSKKYLTLREAYASIYEKKEKPEMEDDSKHEEEEGEKKSKHSKKEKEESESVEEGFGEKTAELLDKGTKKIQDGLEKMGVPINHTKRGTVTQADQEKRIQQNNSADLFDIVKGHLIDEGYADTEEAAVAIMANMSEEWRQSIVEGWAEVRANVTDALPWNRNTKYTTQGELRKPGENVYGQQTGRGLNVQTHAVKKDGKNKTTPPPLRPAPLIQQNKPSGEFPPLMPKPRTKPDRGREFSHGS